MVDNAETCFLQLVHRPKRNAPADGETQRRGPGEGCGGGGGDGGAGSVRTSRQKVRRQLGGQTRPAARAARAAGRGVRRVGMDRGSVRTRFPNLVRRSPAAFAAVSVGKPDTYDEITLLAASAAMPTIAALSKRDMDGSRRAGFCRLKACFSPVLQFHVARLGPVNFNYGH